MRRTHRIFSIYALSIAVLLALDLTTHAQSTGAVTPVTIENFGKLNDNYYRGAQPLADQFTQLKTLGIKTVIDLACGLNALALRTPITPGQREMLHELYGGQIETNGGALHPTPPVGGLPQYWSDEPSRRRYLDHQCWWGCHMKGEFRALQ